jgi:crotonobetaine/carnitine-CoA ligase
LNQSFFGVKTIGWWGMTETITHGTIGSVHLPNRPMSMGRPAPEYGIFVKRDDGAPVEPGEIGHLLVRGIPAYPCFTRICTMRQRRPPATMSAGCSALAIA